MEMYCNLKKIGFFFPVVPYVLQKSLKTDYGLDFKPTAEANEKCLTKR